ncbi:hypothetical protein F5B21DRAFT_504330 [Xylaria acuta]|nr:hypothetical protein F5B21DRAFT_504330 [Xylaria acuta]
MLSMLIVAILLLAAPSSATTLANTALPYEKPITRIVIGAEINTMGVTISDLINTIGTVVTGITRRTIIMVEEGHSHVDKVALVWIIIGVLIAFFAIMALIRDCIVYVDWEQLWGKLPTRTSKGVRDIELGLSRNEERNANPSVEVAKSGGHPFMNKNMIDSRD